MIEAGHKELGAWLDQWGYFEGWPDETSVKEMLRQVFAAMVSARGRDGYHADRNQVGVKRIIEERKLIGDLDQFERVVRRLVFTNADHLCRTAASANAQRFDRSLASSLNPDAMSDSVP